MSVSQLIEEAYTGLKSLVIGLGVTGKALTQPGVTVIYPMEEVERDNLVTYRGHVELIGKDDARYSKGEPGLGREGAKYLVSKGVVAVGATGVDAIPAFQTRVVDTTGAGDCFVGALAARLAAGLTPVEAARFASAAASCSVERLGAAPAMPTGDEVAARLAKA